MCAVHLLFLYTNVLIVYCDLGFLSVTCIHIIISTKKHFMKIVKECRDVIVKKVLEQGWDTHTTHYTHVGPMTPYIVVINYVHDL